MWPKQNFENGFGDWRNRGSNMGWGSRNAGASRNWKSWQGGSRSNNSSYQKKATTKKPTKQPTKRPLSKSGTKTKAVANKRQKLVSYTKIPLTKVMLVNPGSEANDLPELVFGGFYDCVREAKMGKPKHLLHIEVTKKTEKKKREDSSPQADYRVSIPVPSTSVEAVSIISGTNPFEKVLKAHSDRISLKNSIEHWNKVIRARTVALEKREDELLDLQQIEDELEEAAKSDKAEDVPEDERVTKDNADEEMDDSPTKSKSPKEGNSAESEGEEENWTEDKKKEQSEEELKKKAEKEKETRARKQKLVSSVVKKLTSAVEKAKESLAREQEKLDKLSSEFGDELAYFQNEISDEDALSYFKEQLEDVIQPIIEDDKDSDKKGDAADDEEDEEMETATENLDKSKDSVDESEDVEMAEAKDKKEGETEKAVNKEKEKEKEKAEDAETVKKPVKSGKVTETPVWIVVSLKEPLEKAIVTKNSPVSLEDHIKKATMILMKFQPKHKKTIVLKGVTYHGSQEYMKVLNMVLAGPWKAVRKDPEELMKSKSPYTLMSTLKYLVMCQTRREVLDNIMEICELCGKPFKHSEMQQHVKDFCPMREKPCQFCGAVFPVCKMKEHHNSDCPKYPISCPLKCPKKFARDEAEAHKKVCVNALVDCEFESFGCSKQLKRKDLARHVKTAVFEHLALVKGRVTVLTEYIMQNDPEFKDLMKPACPESESK